MATLPAAIPIFDVGPDMKTKDEPGLHLWLVPDRLSAAALIRARVEEEIARLERGEAQGLPDWESHEIEARLNPGAEPDVHVNRALSAFRANRFLLFVDDRQIRELDEEFSITGNTEIRFVRLVALAGG